MCPVTPNQDPGEGRSSETRPMIWKVSNSNQSKTLRRLLEVRFNRSIVMVCPLAFHDNFYISFIGPFPSLVHEPLDEVKSSSNRQFLRAVSPAGSAPTSRGSSSPAPPGSSETEGAPNRERRTRKSVNYAEPKLNTYVLFPFSNRVPHHLTGPTTTKIN